MALLPVSEASARILSGVKRLPAQSCDLSQALGRVTATPLLAQRDQPPFDASAMDGYAVISGDTAEIPVELRVIGTSAAGKAYRGRVKPSSAIRIFTGAPMPSGADAVVIQENTEKRSGTVLVRSSVRPEQNVRKKGLDFKKSEALIPAGLALNARDIGLAAAMNCGSLRVVRRPRVAVLATGDELVLPGERPRADQIVSSNSNALIAMVEAMGAEPVNGGIVRDDLKATVKAVKRLATADILVTTGGASVGDHDYVQEALKLAGVKIDFWKIAMRPGKPFMYGRKGKLHVLGLPGNPVSALICAELFLRPLVRKMLGLAGQPAEDYAELGAPLAANDERQDHLRARLTQREDGRRIAVPFNKQDSSMMRTFREADCLIVRPPHAPAIGKGERVPIILL